MSHPQPIKKKKQQGGKVCFKLTGEVGGIVISLWEFLSVSEVSGSHYPSSSARCSRGSGSWYLLREREAQNTDNAHNTLRISTNKNVNLRFCIGDKFKKQVVDPCYTTLLKKHVISNAMHYLY